MAEWFEDWFASDQYLNVYKHRDESDARKLLALISKNTSISKAELILDAACGAGRYTNLLLQNGYKVIGFDLSLPLLKKALANSRKVMSSSSYFKADIRSVELKKKFGLILNLFTSFGYFDTDEENFRFINNSPNFLKEGGFFVFDYFNKNYLIDHLIPFSERTIQDYVVKEKRRIEKKRVIKEIELEKEGRTNKFTESVSLYSDEEIEKVFRKAGYKTLYKFGSYNGEKFDAVSSQRLVIIFRNEN